MSDPRTEEEHLVEKEEMEVVRLTRRAMAAIRISGKRENLSRKRMTERDG